MSSRQFLLLFSISALSACTGDKSGVDTGSIAPDDTDGDTSEWVDDSGPTIYEIQQGVYALDSIINLEGVTVSSPFTGYGFFITEPAGGPQAGLWVYTSDVEDSEISVEVGDRIAISGVVAEYFGDEGKDSITELVLQSADDLEVLSNDGSLPSIEILSTSDLADPSVAELWESCLVGVENVTVSNDYLGYGEWMVDDAVVIDDMFFDGSPINGEILDLVSGPLYFSYGNYKIEPRSAEDILWTCPADACAEDLDPGDIVITEIMADPAVGGDEEAEWFEVRNLSGQSINLKGLVVADEGDETTTLRTGTVIGVDASAVFGVGAMETWAYIDFEPDGWYSYGLVGLSNDGDSLSLSNSSGVLDTTASYADDIMTEGTAWQLDVDSTDSSSNDDDENWCAATEAIGSSGDLGTPREPNGSCD